MDADGTNIVDLTPVESINGFDFAWSPDSQQIAFACSNAQFLCISYIDGSHLQKLTMPDYTRVQDMAWSPDGSQVAFSLTAADYRNSELYLINTDGSNLHRLFEPTDFDFHDSKPQWSPDGSKILFQSGRRGTMSIYVIKPDGTGLHNLSQGNSLDFGAVWSPDSLNVAYFSWQLDEKSVILYVADASRGNPRKITDNSTFNLLETASPELFWLP
jgi:TolB protein